MHILTSNVNSSAGPAEVTGAFRSTRKVAVGESAVGRCVSCLGSSFLVRRTLHCSIGNEGCVNARAGCCFTSVNVHTTVLGCQRRRRARVVRGVVCGRLHDHKCGISMKLIRLNNGSRGNGFVEGRLRISFIMGHPPCEICVRSTFRVPAPRGRRRRQHPLLSVGSRFHGVIVINSSVRHGRSRLKMLAIKLLSFLASGGVLRRNWARSDGWGSMGHFQ